MYLRLQLWMNTRHSLGEFSKNNLFPTMFHIFFNNYDSVNTYFITSIENNFSND